MFAVETIIEDSFYAIKYEGIIDNDSIIDFIEF